MMALLLIPAGFFGAILLLILLALINGRRKRNENPSNKSTSFSDEKQTRHPNNRGLWIGRMVISLSAAFGFSTYGVFASNPSWLAIPAVILFGAIFLYSAWKLPPEEEEYPSSNRDM